MARAISRAFLFEAPVLRAGTRFFTFHGKLIDECCGAANRRLKSAMLLITGPAERPLIPPRRLARTFTGPNDQRRDPTDERQPNYQQKNHVDSPFRFQRRPGRYSGLSCLEARVLRAGTRFFTFYGKLIDECRGAANRREKYSPRLLESARVPNPFTLDALVGATRAQILELFHAAARPVQHGTFHAIPPAQPKGHGHLRLR